MFLLPVIKAVNKEDERLINKIEKWQFFYEPQQPFYGNILKKDEV